MPDDFHRGYEIEHGYGALDQDPALPRARLIPGAGAVAEEPTSLSHMGQPILGVRHSMAGRFWRDRGGEARVAQAISQSLQVPEIVGRIMAGRGVDLASAEGFLSPSLRTDLPDPSILMDMDAAVARLVRALRGGEEVAVFGDYDVDGATSSALLLRFFAAVGGKLRAYIPDRITEGYGPNVPALLSLRKAGVSLVLTVDCGVLAFEPLEAAAEAGLDVIVVDHHLAQPRLPRAVAVVNPNRLDQAAGLGQLAAVGVTYLLVVAVNRALREAGWYGPDRPEPRLLDWLDLVALGTVCDVVPLTGVNRAFVGQGLKVMARRGNPGLAALADVAGMAETPGTYHAGFLLGPRVNAGGRVGQPDLGTRLLATDDPKAAQAMAQELDRFNQERQTIEALVLERATEKVERALAGTPPGPLVMVTGTNWHPGVIGIVAARIREKFGRPAFVLSLSDGIARGSGRSINGVDLGAAVTAARQEGLLMDGGGHRMAAGLTVAEDRLGDLERFLTGRIEAQVSAATQVDSLGLDGILAAGAATVKLYQDFSRAGPFGAGNPEPRFAFPALRVVNASVVGKGHVRCILAGDEGGRLKGIAFRAAETEVGRSLLKASGRPLHVAGHLRSDNWRGETRVQLVVEDAAWAREA